MSGDFKRGAVICWKDFEFEDGGKSNKLLVILGAKAGKNILAVLTTSKARGRKSENGCHNKGQYFCALANAAGKFPMTTWFELYRPVEISAASLVKAALAKDVWVVKNLPEDLSNAIKNCLKLSDDVTQQHLSLLE